MRLLTESGIRLREELERQNLKVIETYPGAAQDILDIPRKGCGLDVLNKGLSSFVIKGLTADMRGDELDAVTCALMGILYLWGEYRAIGDPDEILNDTASNLIGFPGMPGPDFGTLITRANRTCISHRNNLCYTL